MHGGGTAFAVSGPCISHCSCEPKLRAPHPTGGISGPQPGCQVTGHRSPVVQTIPNKELHHGKHCSSFLYLSFKVYYLKVLKSLKWLLEILHGFPSASRESPHKSGWLPRPSGPTLPAAQPPAPPFPPRPCTPTMLLSRRQLCSALAFGKPTTRRHQPCLPSPHGLGLSLPVVSSQPPAHRPCSP